MVHTTRGCRDAGTLLLRPVGTIPERGTVHDRVRGRYTYLGNSRVTLGDVREQYGDTSTLLTPGHVNH